ncbi:anti-sigma factor [Tannerella forsythia]|uniref:Anti-sigma factor n=2 Tax=Tannerella forsythia TaxID=28112 RepID=A0A2A6EAX4_TANFO|nr:anti-sigma factor [Tannerella forsythia]
MIECEMIVWVCNACSVGAEERFALCSMFIRNNFFRLYFKRNPSWMCMYIHKEKLMENKMDEFLLRYFAGELDKTEERELLDWLNRDDEHKKTFRRIADTWAVAHIPLFVGRLKADGPMLPRARRNIVMLRKRWTGVAVACIISVAIALSAFWVGKQFGNASPDMFYRTTVPAGSRSEVTLPDGSVVWVNAGSSLTYREDRHEQMRSVVLEGEAYFEVKPDRKRPFIVESGGMQVRVLGTKFNVKAYGDEETVDVVLLSGKVAVRLNERGEETYALSPDEKLTFHRETHHIEKHRVEGRDYCAWKEGRICFDEQPFTELVRTLERLYNVRIQIDSEQLKTERFSGSFLQTSSLDEILREIDMEHRYDWSHDHTGALVIRDRSLFSETIEGGVK